MNEDDLIKLGLPIDLQLHGQVELIQFVKNTPIVFLFDEIHDDDSLIQLNIINAKELIRKGNVKGVGVESHSGGRLWDEFNMIYEEYFDEEFTNCSTSPALALALMTQSSVSIFGVECFGMLSKIEMDNKNLNLQLEENPINKQRSKHFIKTIFEVAKRNKLKGNFILNCGLNHNSHISEWIKMGKLNNIVNEKATYVRINTGNL